MDKQMYTGMILADLQKAFDTLDHGVFLEKKYYILFPGHLQLNGISNTENSSVVLMFFLRLEHLGTVNLKAIFLDNPFFNYM